MKSGAAPWVHGSGLALADFGRDPHSSNSLGGSKNFFCEVNNARIHRFPIGLIVWHLNVLTMAHCSWGCLWLVNVTCWWQVLCRMSTTYHISATLSAASSVLMFSLGVHSMLSFYANVFLLYFEFLYFEGGTFPQTSASSPSPTLGHQLKLGCTLKVKTKQKIKAH